MFSALLKRGSAKRSQILAVDLGQRTTKAVDIVRKGDAYAIQGFVIMDAPAVEKQATPEVLAAHLKAVVAAMGHTGKKVSLILGGSESIFKLVEMPMVAASEMRTMLKFGSKNYFQQELTDHCFDCHVISLVGGGGEPGKGLQKARVAAAATKNSVVEHYVEACKQAGLVLEMLTPSSICPINAFELAMPEAFAKEIVALVEIGFRSSSISILRAGEFMMNRVVPLGGDKLTTGLSDTLNVSYSEAEGMKFGMPEEIQYAMQALLMPLGRELRASIDFFEHQFDKTVPQVLVSGGSARSQFVIDTLQGEMMVSVKGWNPGSFLQVALPGPQILQWEQSGPNVAVAVGGALGGF